MKLSRQKCNYFITADPRRGESVYMYFFFLLFLFYSARAGDPRDDRVIGGADTFNLFNVYTVQIDRMRAPSPPLSADSRKFTFGAE